eukprot:655531-Pelagomonas_calceolata.AAC.10
MEDCSRGAAAGEHCRCRIQGHMGAHMHKKPERLKIRCMCALGLLMQGAAALSTTAGLSQERKRAENGAAQGQHGRKAVCTNLRASVHPHRPPYFSHLYPQSRKRASAR